MRALNCISNCCDDCFGSANVVLGEAGCLGGEIETSERAWGPPALVRGTRSTLIFWSANPFRLGRGCESRIDHYLVDGVPALSDDELQVQIG